jgi:hypothetical protein
MQIEGDVAALSAKTDLGFTQLPALLMSLNLGSMVGLAEFDPIAARIAEELRAITA